MKKVAVTGGVASGKSVVCQFFKECGAYVVDADAIVHRLLSSDTAIKEQIIHLLGTEIVVGTQIDRKKLAEIVLFF